MRFGAGPSPANRCSAMRCSDATLCRAAVWHGPGDVRVDVRRMPVMPARGAVRITVDWCGLCGSDLLEYLEGPVVIPIQTGSTKGTPLVLGHEFVGTVIAVSPGSDHVAVGDFVAVDTLVRCGACHYCRSGEFNLCPDLGVIGLTVDGGFAEAVDVPAYMCYRVDPGLARDTAALAEPLAVAIRAIRQAKAEPGRPVAVVGCGSIGLLCVMVARHAGVERVVAVDLADRRRRAAERAGATETADRIPELDAAAGPWALLDCTGSPIVTGQLVTAAPAKSRIALVGVTPGNVALPLKEVLDKELELVGSLSHDGFDFKAAVDLLADGSFEPGWLITQRIPLEDLPGTIARLAAGEARDQLKVVVTPDTRTP
jgi:(R,R)-butanediol dehydrogenase / meso-butanediol dehydrogenase / diacetyl reductase